MVAMVQAADLAVCSHHLPVVAETKAVRAEASAVCSHLSLVRATSTVVLGEVSPVFSLPSLAADRVVAVCSARVKLTRTAQAALKDITALRRRLQALLPPAMEDTSSRVTARSRQQASSLVITMRILQLTNRAIKCHMPSHLSRLTMDHTAILSSSSSSRTDMAKEGTDNQAITVDTSMVRVVKVVGTKSTGEREYET